MEGLLIFQKLKAPKAAACSELDTKSKQRDRQTDPVLGILRCVIGKKMQTIRRNVMPSSLNVSGSQNTCNTFLPTVKNRSSSDAASYPRRLENSELNHRDRGREGEREVLSCEM
jgi:hypothetical protein